MNFCSHCGKKVVQKIPENDNRLRFVCPSCKTIHYQNPNVVAGVLPLIVDNDGIEKVLMCRRAIEPRYGYWTLPAGFMENEETLEQAAARESIEEANLLLNNLKLYMVMSLPHISQVYVMYIGQADNNFSPGIESLDTKLFTESDIPWDELSFPVVKKTLKSYFTDRTNLLKSLDKPSNNYTLLDTDIDSFPVHHLVHQVEK